MGEGGRHDDLRALAARVRHAGAGLVDQSLFSVANLGAALLLARWLPTEELGAWALAYAVFVVAAYLHTAFVLDPMGALAPSLYADQKAGYLRATIPLHMVLCVPAATVVALGATVTDGSRVRTTILVIAVALPLLLLPWLLRRVLYVLGRPATAAAGSAVYSAGVLGGLAAAHRSGGLDAPTAVMVMAGASVTSALVMYARLRGSAPEARGPSLRGVAREHWRLGSWLGLAAALLAIGNQAPIVLAGKLLGLDEAATLRAMLTPVQPILQVIATLLALAVPPMAAAFAACDVAAVRRSALRLSLVLVALASAFEGLLLVGARPIERIVYGGRFAHATGLLPLFGAIAVVLAATAGITAAFYASRRPAAIVIAAIVSTPATVVLGLALIPRYGVDGAAWSSLLGYLVYAAVMVLLYESRRAIVAHRP